jgi:nucleotide-binding universal stress UspA family protein
MNWVIGVAFDGSASSRRALEQAIARSKLSGEPMRVLVVSGGVLNQLGPSLVTGGPPSDEASRRLIAGEIPADTLPVLEEARDRLNEANVRGEIIRSVGDPADEIRELVREQGVTCLFMGAHHHRRFWHIFDEDVPADVRRRVRSDVQVVD